MVWALKGFLIVFADLVLVALVLLVVWALCSEAVSTWWRFRRRRF